MPAYDLVVIGSDEVWNFSHPWYGGQPLFFGRGLNAPRVVSYAASFGNHDAATGMDPAWADQLARLDAISVRDANSHRLVQQALGRQVPLVLDPCLQFPPAVESADTSAGPAYAVLYGHGFSDRFGALVRAWADRRGLELVSLGYRNDFAHRQWLDADPLDFARAMAGATAVVTNFFHGCVFALLNGKPFVCAGTPYRMNKVRDLTRTLLAGDHLLTEVADPAALDILLDRPLDPAINRAIAALRRQSETYLPSIPV